MRIAFSGLSGPFLAFANSVQAVFNQLASVRLTIFDTVSDLPNAEQWHGRQVIVRDIDGAGTMGIATALDGAWLDYTGATIA